MRLLYKVAFVSFLCVYLIGPFSFADAACKGSKCSRRRKSEEKQMNKEGDSITRESTNFYNICFINLSLDISEIEASNKKSSGKKIEYTDRVHRSAYSFR